MVDDKNNSDLPDFLMGAEPPEKKEEPTPPQEDNGPARRASDPAAAAEEATVTPSAPTEDDVVIPSSLLSAGTAEELDQDELDQYEIESASPETGGKMGAIVLGVTAVILVGLIGFVATNEGLKKDISCFFSGNIETCKQEDKIAQEKQWAKEAGLMRNQYASLEAMRYTPQEARVNVTQLMWKETHTEFLQRVDKGGADMRGEPTRKDIPNKSHGLKDREKVDGLTIMDLPVLEKEDLGEDAPEEGKELSEEELAKQKKADVFSFAYEVEITKDLYYPRKYLFASKSHYPGEPPKDAQVLWFNEGIPGQMSINWTGCDLRPRPEFWRPNYVQAMVRENCDRNSAEGKKMLRDETIWQDHLRDIRAEFKFRTDAEWMEVETALKANVELWPQIETEIAEGKCGEE